MDDDAPLFRMDAAHSLASEALGPLSVDELDERVALLKTEIERISAHRQSALSHRAAADALFKK